jgi:hypothetical protein
MSVHELGDLFDYTFSASCLAYLTLRNSQKGPIKMFLLICVVVQHLRKMLLLGLYYRRFHVVYIDLLALLVMWKWRYTQRFAALPLFRRDACCREPSPCLLPLAACYHASGICAAVIEGNSFDLVHLHFPCTICNHQDQL